MFHRDIGRAIVAAVQDSFTVWALTAVAAIGTWVPSAQACSVCGCGEPLASLGQTRLKAGQVQLAMEYEFLTARARSDSDPALVETLTQMTLRPVFVFSPWDNLMAIVQIPLVYKRWAEATPGVDPNSARPKGLGDVDLSARLFVLNRIHLARRSRESLALSAGTSLPTGPNAAQANGDRIDEHAQLGTGAWAPYAGVLYSLSREPWSFFASINGRLPLRNDYGYRYGSALLWSSRVERQLGDRVFLGVGLDGRYAWRDEHDRTLQSNTGGLVLAAVPLARVRLWDELWLNGRAQLPFVTHLFGDQSVGATFTAAVQYTFQ
jgi:hypothetical protein